MFKPRAIVLIIASILSTGTYALDENNTKKANSTPAFDETTSGLADQHSVAVTIYNNDLALVKDTRKLQVRTGLNALAFRDVSAQIRPETTLLRSINSPGSLVMLEQNFVFDLLTPQKLLEKYVGKTVGLVKVHPTTGVETIEQATVLSANDGLVMKVGNNIETGISGRIVYDGVPANLRDRPTLITQINNKGSQDQTIELSYLTGGLGWKADYVAELNEKEDKLDLSGLITLNNSSGTSYKKVKLQLVAGDVNRVQQNMAPMVKTMRMESMTADAEAPMAQESLLEYHLYTMDKLTTISDNQTKQVALLSASGVPVRKELLLIGADYYYQGQYGEIGTKMKVGVFIEFENKEASKLGMPLPKGILRVYKKDSVGNAQFVGEDNIDHTPKNESVRLKLGNAFDVTADKKQTDFKVLPRPTKHNNLFETAIELTLKNAKKEKVTVTVHEPIGGDWKIISESHPHTKANSHLAVWKIEVPAESSSTLTYRALVKY